MRKIWKKSSIVKAICPLRVDLSGMTDYIQAQGSCVNSTIGLIARLSLSARTDKKITVDAGSYGIETFSLDEIPTNKNMFARALDLVGYTKAFDFGMDVKVDCEYGAIGLSSSSSVGAMYYRAAELIMNQPNDPLEVAKATQAIEPHWYGRQDQLAVAFGGFNLWRMTAGKVVKDKAIEFGQVERFPIFLPESRLSLLAEESFLLYHSGIEEGAKGVLDNIITNYESNKALKDVFKKMSNLAEEVYSILLAGSKDEKWLGDLGETFDEIRAAHEKLHPTVTNERMRALFAAAKRAGALGGRYSGAGGRGALTFICRPGDRAKIAAALSKIRVPYTTEKGVVFDEGRQIHFGGFNRYGATAWFA